jgi:CheY-like chemotaxis protein
MNSIKKMFLVDDDDTFIYISQKIIAKTELVQEINTFENGLAALSFFKANKDNKTLLPELLFLDLSMPVMDGWEFLDEYEKINIENKKDITIYICSSSISPNDLIRTKKYDYVKDFIIKPITQEKLTQIVATI